MIVELVNIQSISKAIYDLDEIGVTQIVGENSNGKSILIKAVSFVANTLITDKDEREAIIKDNTNMSTISMSRKGMNLKVTISRERENCRYELTRSNGEVITRTIREGGLELLADEFGWMTFDGNICLQIFETFGIMPFVNNKESGDYNIIDCIITDKVANNFIDNYKDVTFPAFRDYVKDLKTKIGYTQKELDSITFYNISEYEDILYKLKQYERNISNLKTYSPTKLPITKAFNYVDVNSYIPRRLPIFSIAPEVPKLETLHTQVLEYSEALKGVCPTCGVEFRYLGVHGHEI